MRPTPERELLCPAELRRLRRAGRQAPPQPPVGTAEPAREAPVAAGGSGRRRGLAGAEPRGEAAAGPVGLGAAGTVWAGGGGGPGVAGPVPGGERVARCGRWRTAGLRGARAARCRVSPGAGRAHRAWAWLGRVVTGALFVVGGWRLLLKRPHAVRSRSCEVPGEAEAGEFCQRGSASPFARCWGDVDAGVKPVTGECGAM